MLKDPSAYQRVFLNLKLPWAGFNWILSQSMTNFAIKDLVEKYIFDEDLTKILLETEPKV